MVSAAAATPPKEVTICPAMIGKIQATGTTGGKAWGAAFLGYVESNVPAALVGMLVDLVTPGVRAKLTEEASAGGAV